jgi:hypothetical protein
MLESELQPKLKNSRVMSVDGMEKGIASQTIHAASPCSRIVSAGAAVTADNVVAGIPGMRKIIDSE